jgi:heterodisulfide reductase subunit A-like polyferredoxin
MSLQNSGLGNEKVGAVLICGAGIAGIQAALDLAGSGFKVYLLDSAAAIGGRMAQLDKTFPTGDCAMCILSPKLVECARNRNIEIITLADIQSLSGAEGHFKVKIRQNPRYIDVKKCEACGDCAEVCPVSLSNEFDGGFGTRKAIFKPYPQAIPNVFAISKAAGQAPCKASCPAGVNVQGAAALIVAGKFTEAYDLVRRRCPLPASCGRVCHRLCEKSCNRKSIDDSVAFGDVERFIGDFIQANPGLRPPSPISPASLGKRIAVVGGGPAGLTAAADLRLMGYEVTLLEAKPKLGGMLQYGIPNYRLPKNVLDREIQSIIDLGIDVKLNTPVLKPADLLKSSASDGSGFDAAFVAIGAWKSQKLGIAGEDAQGVWGVLEFLHDVNSGNPPSIGHNVLVIGSSDLALEGARCAARLPGVASVHLVCLETPAEMTAQSEQAAQALDEGVIFLNGMGPTRIDAQNEKVASVTFRACISAFENYRGYRRYNPLFDDSQITKLQADAVIIAVGRGVDSARLKIETRPGGRILADKETLATSIKGIFAGGEAALGPASLVEAIAQGHKAAESIDAFIRGAANIRSAKMLRVSAAPPNLSAPKCASNPKLDAPKQDRIQMPQSHSREKSMSEINLGYDLEQAQVESRRCLSCGLCSECMQCVKACSAGAILHDQQPSELEIEVGGVILAPGMEEFQASLWKELGHGNYDNVLTAVQFERMLSVMGSGGGSLQRPSDGSEVKKIAFIQCVGSLNPLRGMSYCSSVCCMSAAKQAIIASEYARNAPLEISIFCMDVRTSGKEFDSYVHRAREECGVKYVRAQLSRIKELTGSKNLQVNFLDETGEVKHEEFDLVILSAGIRISSSVQEMAKRLGINLNPAGFVQTDRLAPLATSRPGVYVAGSFQEPKDIPESAAQGSAAAACLMEQLTEVRGTMIKRREYPWERDVADEPPRIGVFVCQCGHNISSVVDADQVAREAARLPNVLHAEVNPYTCSEANQQRIKEVMHKSRLNRLVVASCSSRTHEALFQETLRESGLNQFLFAMTDIRDQCSWVHRDDPVAATNKAKDLVAMAVARARHLQQLPLYELPVAPSALILGGGLAGMTAAQTIAAQGFNVHLLERDEALGGLLRNIHATLERADVPAFLKQLIQKTKSNPKIKIYLKSELVKIAGQAGNFTSVINTAGGETEINHGVLIVATGGKERATSKFLNGKNNRVLTQSKLESALAGGKLPSKLGGKQAPVVVMIQCVESRDEKNPYCSRVCCSEAVKNALELKKQFPLSSVYIIGRDIRTNGFREDYYQKALHRDIVFVRCSESQGPEVTAEGDRMRVKVHDVLIGRDYDLHPDLLALSTGISPAENGSLSTILRSALTLDGFYQEAHPKLRPVDLANEGEFVCGLAHSPRFMDETIAQAQAAAARATNILSKKQLEITGQIALVDPAECVACTTCVKNCAYGAPMINELRKAEIQSAKCMGCGGCVATCPARAIRLLHQDGEATSAMLQELLAIGGRQ